MSFHHLWSQASRRTGGTPSGVTPSFAPAKWPLTPRAKVPTKDPSDGRDDADPGLDNSASGGASSGIHGTGSGRNGRDNPNDPANKNPHHGDDHSEPHVSSRKDIAKRRGIRGLRSRRKDEPGVDREEMAVSDTGPSAAVHSAAAIDRDDFARAPQPPRTRLPGTVPLRYITPSKRGRAGLGAARSRKLPGSPPATGPLPEQDWGQRG